MKPIAIIILALTLLAGCKSANSAPPYVPNTSVHPSDVQTAMERENKVISDAADAGLAAAATQPATPPAVRGALYRIKQANNEQKQTAADMTTVVKHDAQADADKASVQKQLEACNHANDDGLNGWMNMIIVGCCVLFGLGLVAAVYGAKLAVTMPVLASWLTGSRNVSIMMIPTIALCLAIQAVGPYKWIAGITSMILLAGVMVWFVYRGAKATKTTASLQTTATALTQVVQTIDAVKPNMAQPELVAQAASQIQSPATTAMVAAVRNGVDHVAATPTA